MKRIIIIAIFIACWLTTAKAQMIVSAEKEIRDLETLRLQAMEKVDVATLDRIISDDLIYSKGLSVLACTLPSRRLNLLRR